MKGLSERFAELQVDQNISNTELALRLFKDIFLRNSSEDDAPAKQQTTRLRVFGAGLPRSGTGSLALALSELGYTPLHGPGIFELAPILHEHYHSTDEERSSLRQLIQWQEDHGFDAQGLDMLGWKLYSEAAKLPDTKIVLTVHPRGAEAWAESFSSFVPDHIYWFGQKPFAISEAFRLVILLQRECLKYVGGNDDPTDPVFRFPGKSLAQGYQEHNAAVQKAVPADRLLVFDPTQGWEPLCSFLEIEPQDCPKTPYPHMTDRQTMMVMSRVAGTIVWGWSVIPLVLVAIVASFFNRKWKGRKKPKIA